MEAFGLLSAMAPGASAGYRISVRVIDLDDDIVVASQKVAEDTERDGVSQEIVSDLLVLPVTLTRGHSYRVALIVTVLAEAGVDETASADFLSDGFVDWDFLTVRAGSDPFGPIDSLTERVEALEEESAEAREDIDELREDVDVLREDADELREDLDELREDFDGHTHEYLTGRGNGHNNTKATTTTPDNAGEEKPDERPDDHYERDPEPKHEPDKNGKSNGKSKGPR